MEVSDYSPTHRWFPVLAVVWWQPNRRQIRWARLRLNKTFSVDAAVSLWPIYSTYSIMFKSCRALKRWNNCHRVWDRHWVFSVTFQTSFQGAELWISLCNSSDFVTLEIPLAFGCSATQCTLSVIACNSMWGLSPDGSAGSTSNPPSFPQETFCDPSTCCTQQKKKNLTNAECSKQKSMTAKECVCALERERRGRSQVESTEATHRTWTNMKRNKPQC